MQKKKALYWRQICTCNAQANKKKLQYFFFFIEANYEEHDMEACFFFFLDSSVWEITLTLETGGSCTSVGKVGAEADCQKWQFGTRI